MKNSGKICVLGSFVVDLTSRAQRLPIKGETIIGSMFKMGPGGKGSNQAVAASRAGGDVKLITKVGRDVFGDLACENFKKENLYSELIFVDDKLETGTALIMVDDDSSNSILVVPGACGDIRDEELELAKTSIAESAILLTQLEINMDATRKGIEIAHENHVTVVLNTAPVQPVDDDLLSMVNIVTPNEVEAHIITGIDVKNEEDCHLAADYFFRKGVKKVIITMGEKGVYANDGEQARLIPVIDVKPVDTTGAGDAFNGGFVVGLAEGMDFFSAVEFGNQVAGLAVTRFGTSPSMPYRKEVDDLRIRLSVN